MRNEATGPEIEPQPADHPADPTPAPVRPAPLVLLATGDDDAVCTDELCVPAEIRPS